MTASTFTSSSLPWSLIRLIRTLALFMGVLWATGYASPASDFPPGDPSWHRLLHQASTLDLPAEFLGRIRPDFVSVTFADLRSFAAEYHPDEHRMVLNRSLSFNAAGSVLRPLKHLTHREVATLYHELFHAYLDYVQESSGNSEADPQSRRLLAFARLQQECRYRQVLITPVRQRKSDTEMRFLTTDEAWEALNETWAVFVEWAIWTRLELRDRTGAGRGSGTDADSVWLARLQAAERAGLLVGFYEPADPQEQALTSKRYLAPSFRISPPEVAILLEVVLGESRESAQQAYRAMEGPAGEPGAGGHCASEPLP